MPAVMVYGFTGSVDSVPEYDWGKPDPGISHKCMLFLVQAEESTDFAFAQQELSRFGFGTVAFGHCGAMQVEALNSDAYRGFSAFYHEAMEHGSSVVWYSNDNGHAPEKDGS